MANADFSFLDEISKHCSLQNSLTFNRPYEYKGIAFHPVPLGRLNEFYICLEILTIKQERMKDKRLVKMPYLWFLVYAYENCEKYQDPRFATFMPLLSALIELTTGIKNVSAKFQHKPDGRFAKCFLVIDGAEFNSKDFSEIRRIIFAQNGIENTFDEFIHESAERAINQSRLNEMEKSGFVQPTHDDLLNKFCVYMRKSKGEVKESFFVRDFNKFLTEMSVFEEYRILKTGECSGMVKFSKPIPHWFSGHKKTDMFRDQDINYKNNNLMKIGNPS